MLKLVVGFKSHGLIHLLDLGCSNVVTRPMNQKLQNFLRFHKFLKSTYDSRENEVSYFKIGHKLEELELNTSFGAKWPKCNF